MENNYQMEVVMTREDFSRKAKEAAELAMQPVVQEIRERMRAERATEYAKMDLTGLLTPRRS